MNRRQFFGTALLSLCAAHSRRHGLLSENTRPPLFTLQDSADHAVQLQAALSEYRVVLLFVPRQQVASGQQYLKTVRENWKQFRERDILVLVIEPSSSHLDGEQVDSLLLVLTDEHGKVAHEYGADGSSPTFYLIGKDGTIKMARHGYPRNEELFGTIDAMPMRRQEMRERGR